MEAMFWGLSMVESMNLVIGITKVDTRLEQIAIMNIGVRTVLSLDTVRCVAGSYKQIKKGQGRDIQNNAGVVKINLQADTTVSRRVKFRILIDINLILDQVAGKTEEVDEFSCLEIDDVVT